MEKCPLCGGEKRIGSTIYTVDLGFGLVVVKDVPAKVCSQCGEEWISSEIASQLENVINWAKKKHFQLEVISFPELKLTEVSG